MRRIGRMVLALTSAALLFSASHVESATPFTGTLDIIPHGCTAALTGSYFEMFSSTGANVIGFPGEGCSAVGGSAGRYPLTGRVSAGKGLTLDGYQYDDTLNPNGNGYTGVLDPFSFFGQAVYLNTSPFDYQDGSPVAAPHLEYDPGICVIPTCRLDPTVSNITAWDVSYGGGNFNQGSPKPDGTFPSLGSQGTTQLTGTYKTSTSRDYRVYWQSLIIGGGFNGFTGHWQLSGQVIPTFTTPTPPTATPTPSISIVIGDFRNNTGQYASDFHVSFRYVDSVQIHTNAPGCPPPVSTQDDPIVPTKFNVVWSSACVAPGDVLRIQFKPTAPFPSITEWFYTLFGTRIPTPTASPTYTPTNTPTFTPTFTPTPLSACEQQWGVTSFTANGNKGKLSAMVVGNIVDPTNIKGKGTRISLCAGTSVSVLVSDTSGTPTNTALTTGIACDSSGCQVGSLQGRQKFLSESNDGTDKLRITLLAY